jgi:hypothetical protein
MRATRIISVGENGSRSDGRIDHLRKVLLPILGIFGEAFEYPLDMRLIRPRRD